MTNHEEQKMEILAEIVATKGLVLCSRYDEERGVVYFLTDNPDVAAWKQPTSPEEGDDA